MVYDTTTSLYKNGMIIIRKGAKTEQVDELGTKSKYVSSVEYSYWKQLVSDYNAMRTQEKQEAQYVKKELDLISQLAADLNMKEGIISRTKSQITQLEAHICSTHAHLETMKYRAIKKEELQKRISHHNLARESPYPGTKIERIPVPDKYVPWEVMWLHYEPQEYTMPKDKFSRLVQNYVDEDILSLKKGREEEKDDYLPVYKWNMDSKDTNDIYRNRKSWITNNKNEAIHYRLDKYGLPRNPMGRTGLEGRGSLPRWGPNHTIFVIITRWKWKEVEKVDTTLEDSNFLEYVQTYLLKEEKKISLPGGFAWSENKYEVIQSCFKLQKDTEPWKTPEPMIQFFEEHAVGSLEEEVPEDSFKCEMMYCGYMDDQLNTDQAWKEVEIWHIHYNVWTDLYKKFKTNIAWKLLSEEIFINLPYGQTTLLQDAIRPLNAKIANS